jgi:hypothetical protein
MQLTHDDLRFDCGAPARASLLRHWIQPTQVVMCYICACEPPRSSSHQTLPLQDNMPGLSPLSRQPTWLCNTCLCMREAVLRQIHQAPSHFAACCGPNRARLAWLRRQSIRNVGHAILWLITVFGAPCVGGRIKVQALTRQNDCAAKQQQQRWQHFKLTMAT